MTILQFVHPFTLEGVLSCFCFWQLAVVNKATINSCVRIFVAVDVFLTALGKYQRVLLLIIW